MFKYVVVLAIAACGGKTQPAATGAGPTTEGPAAAPPPTPCDITARKMTDAVFKWKEPPPTSQDNVFSVLNKHCNDDKWSMEAQECFRNVTDEASSAPCAEKLTKEQLDHVMGAMYAKFDDGKGSK
jgi:hypothetical protein